MNFNLRNLIQKNDQSRILNNNPFIKNVALGKDIPEGTVFSGLITDIRGRNIKIDLGNNQLLMAIMEDSVSLNIGEKISFSVKSNDGPKIILRPVYDQTQQNSSLIKSLEAANIPQSEKNISIVKNMMSRSMSIDKDILNEIIRNTNSYPNEDPVTIIAMKKFNIPINDENITQFKKYQNYENQISNELKSLSPNIIDVVEKIINREEPSYALKFIKDIVDIFSSKEQEEPPLLKNDANGESKQNVQIQKNNILLEKATTLNVENEKTRSDNNILNNITDNTVEINKKNQELKPQFTKDVQPLYEKFIQNNKFKNLLEVENTFEKFNGIIKIIKEKHFINPREMVNKEKSLEIKDIINRNLEEIDQDTEKLIKLLETTDNKETNLYKSTSNIKNNIDFMSNLNNMLSYIQIPIKTEEGHGNSQLYVYNKNKSKLEKEGPLTAFLHLDMENLGGTDVNIKMEKNSLETRFTLFDPVSQKIVSQHINELKERLEKAGYTVIVSVEEIKETKMPFEDILSGGVQRGGPKRYSFDMRM